MYFNCSIRSVASGLASHGCDVDLCVSGPILDRIKNEAENKNILRIRISELISEFGRILGGKGKYFIDFNRVFI
jgi:hypothetical protein